MSRMYRFAGCFLTLALAAIAQAEDKNEYPIAAGPFNADMDTLKQYKYPDWFRDAKFGIWAHWGPQAVPMDGDWYARGHVRARQQPLQVSCRALRASVEVRL